MKMKKLVSLLLAVITVFSMLQVTASAETKGPAFDDTSCPYSDVNPSDDFYSAAIYLYYQDIMKGVSDGVFGADVKLDRGQLVTMLWRMDGAPEVDAEVPFVDCPQSKYYYDAVKWASACGVVAGVDATHFKPDQSVTEQDALLVLYRFIRDYSRYRDDQNDNYTDDDFKELYKSYKLKGFSGYAKCAAAWAYKNQILRNTNIGAKSACPRKNTANYLYRAILKYMANGNNGVPSTNGAVLIDNIDAFFNIKPYGQQHDPAITEICRLINKGDMGIQKINGKDYLVFGLRTNFLYFVNPEVFTERDTDTWTSLSRVYPSNEAIGSALSALHKDNNPSDRRFQGFMRIYRPENSTYYTVDLAQLKHKAKLDGSSFTAVTYLYGSCEFSFSRSYSGEITALKKQPAQIGFTPTVNLVAMPKNKSYGDFNYLECYRANCRGKKRAEKWALDGVLSTYDIGKQIASYLIKPSVGEAIAKALEEFLKSQAPVGDDDSVIDNFSVDLINIAGIHSLTNSEKAGLSLPYEVIQTAPKVLKKCAMSDENTDQFEVIIECVPGIDFPQYYVTINPGITYG